MLTFFVTKKPLFNWQHWKPGNQKKTPRDPLKPLDTFKTDVTVVYDSHPPRPTSPNLPVSTTHQKLIDFHTATRIRIQEFEEGPCLGGCEFFRPKIPHPRPFVVRRDGACWFLLGAWALRVSCFFFRQATTPKIKKMCSILCVIYHIWSNLCKCILLITAV